MQVTVEKLSPVLVEFQIEVPADQVRSEVDKAYVTLQRTARVKGKTTNSVVNRIRRLSVPIPSSA